MASRKPCKCGCGQLIDGNSMKKFASNKCRQKAYRDRNKKRFAPRPFRADRICAFCSQRYVAIHPSQRCCKRAHRQAMYRQLKQLNGIQP